MYEDKLFEDLDVILIKLSVKIPVVDQFAFNYRSKNLLAMISNILLKQPLLNAKIYLKYSQRTLACFN